MDYNLFNNTLLKASLSQEDFSRLTDIPFATMMGWKAKRNKKGVPKWVETYLNLYIENKEQKIIIKDLKKDIRSYDKN